MLKWEKKSDWVVVDMTGELDMSNAIDFKNEIINEFVSKGELNIALNFENMEYIDSSGLGVIVSLHKRCKLNIYSNVDSLISNA
jgi:anti-sigma B factor antagonist